MSRETIYRSPQDLDGVECFRVTGSIPLMPLHTDDFAATTAEDILPQGRFVLESPALTQLKRRRANRSNVMWFYVQTEGGRRGWVSEQALLMKHIAIL